jgi:hypothetical protein
MARFVCERCCEGWSDLIDFCGKSLCPECVVSCRCADCKERLCLPGWDFCRECSVAVFAADPAAFTDYVRHNGMDDVAQYVLAQQPKLRALVNYDPRRLSEGEAS